MLQQWAAGTQQGEPELGLDTLPGKETQVVFHKSAPQVKNCLFVEKHLMPLLPLSMRFHSYPGSHAGWLRLHDKQPRPLPHGGGCCVPAEVKTG